MHEGFVGRLLSELIIESLPGFLSALLLCLPEVTKAKSYIASFLGFQAVSERKIYKHICVHTCKYSPRDYNYFRRFFFPQNLYIIKLLHFDLMRKAYLLKTKI